MSLRARWALFILLITSVVIYFLRIYNLERLPKQQQLEFRGQTMGTIPYSVKMLWSESLPLGYGIDSVLKAFNQSLSTYIPDSEISTFNRADSLVYESSMFYPVLQRSKEIYEHTSGAFDPTVGPLVNAWGFGPDRSIETPDAAVIDSLIKLTGFDKIRFSQQLVTKNPGMYLDFSAIAKGYAIDLVGAYLESFGAKDYLVEIGGEVRARGQNLKGSGWTIGIDDPLVEKTERKILAILEVNDLSLATSGNYRNYYEKDGKTYAHIIDPRTGYNRQHNLLSASVFTPDCMSADAYATGFMVMGLDDARNLVEQTDQMEAVLVYQENSVVKTYVSPGLQSKIRQLNTDQ